MAWQVKVFTVESDELSLIPGISRRPEPASVHKEESKHLKRMREAELTGKQGQLHKPSTVGSQVSPVGK